MTANPLTSDSAGHPCCTRCMGSSASAGWRALFRRICEIPGLSLSIGAEAGELLWQLGGWGRGSHFLAPWVCSVLGSSWPAYKGWQNVSAGFTVLLSGWRINTRHDLLSLMDTGGVWKA